MDIALIGAAYEGLRVGKEILIDSISAKADAQAKEKIHEVMTKLGAAQDALFQLRDELYHLQTENSELKQSLADMEEWETRLSEYELVKTSGGAVVYQFNGDPQHYACPNCLEKKQIHILQDTRNLGGHYRCVSCEAEYPINPSQSIRRAGR